MKVKAFFEKIRHSLRLLMIDSDVKKYVMDQDYVIEDLIGCNVDKQSFTPSGMPCEYYWVTKYTYTYKLKTDKGIIEVEYVWYTEDGYDKRITIKKPRNYIYKDLKI